MMKSYTTVTPKKDRKRLRWIMLAVAGVLALGLIAGIVALRQVYSGNLKPVHAAGSEASTHAVVIQSGATINEIADLLKQNGLIRETWAFKWYVRSREVHGEMQAGTYKLSTSQSVQEIVDQIVEGRVATDLFTILPGQRLDQIKEAFTKAKFKPADIEAAFNPKTYAGHPALVDKPASAPLEGYLYPESFQRTALTTPQTIIRASLDEMQLRLKPEVRKAFASQRLSTYQAIILASIVEREVPSGPDRKVVAQVFYKRLATDMKLESDATASYGAILAGDQPSLTYESAYNTYLHPGLTPTPISNVSENSLLAVAYPAETDYLYFVSGDDNKTYFSKTLEEHEAKVARYCKRKCAAQ